MSSFTNSSSDESSSDDGQNATQSVLPAGRVNCRDCDKPHDEKQKIVVCYGPGHPRAIKEHANCVGHPDLSIPYLCEKCEAIAAMSDDSEVELSDSEDEDTSTGTSHPIVDYRYNREKSRDEFKLVTNSGKIERWQAAKFVDSGLIKEFWRKENGVDYDSDDSNGAAALKRPTIVPATVSDAEATNNEFWDPLQLGYWAVSLATYRDVKRHAAAKDMPSRDIYGTVALEILATIHIEVLEVICGSSSLTRNVLGDPGLQLVLDRLRSKSVNRPCIYMLELVAKNGGSMTKADMREVVELGRTYANPRSAEDLDIAREIDSVAEALTRDQLADEDYRRYLTNDHARSRWKVFLDQLEARLNRLESGDDEPVNFCLRDIGYTDDGIRRVWGQHLTHSSANNVASLFEAICIAFKDRLGGREYRLQGYVVFLCSKKIHASFGEVLLSVLAQAYIETGRGVNGKDAGENMGGLEKKYALESQWDDFCLDTLASSTFYVNVEAEADRVTDTKQKLANIRETIASEELGAVNDEIKLLEANLGLEEEVAELYSEIARINDEADQI